MFNQHAEAVLALARAMENLTGLTAKMANDIKNLRQRVSLLEEAALGVNTAPQRTVRYYNLGDGDVGETDRPEQATERLTERVELLEHALGSVVELLDITNEIAVSAHEK